MCDTSTAYFTHAIFGVAIQDQYWKQATIAAMSATSRTNRTPLHSLRQPELPNSDTPQVLHASKRECGRRDPRCWWTAKIYIGLQGDGCACDTSFPYVLVFGCRDDAIEAG